MECSGKFIFLGPISEDNYFVWEAVIGYLERLIDVKGKKKLIFVEDHQELLMKEESSLLCSLFPRIIL